MTTTLKQAKLWVGGYDLSGAHNQVDINIGKDVPEDTRFGMDSRSYLPDGLHTVMIDHAGLFDADDANPQIDDRLWVEHIGTGLTVLTVAAVGAIGDIGYSFEGIAAQYTPFGNAVGDAHSVSGHMEGSGDAVRGTIMEPGVAARSSSGNSAEFGLGDLVAGEIGYAALHVIATTGSPTLDVDIESDVTGFASPTTRISFAQATDQTNPQFLSTTTPTADDFWRVAWIFGGTGSVTFVVNFGIN